MKRFALALACVVVVALPVVADQPKAVCESGNCRVVDVPKKVVEGVAEVSSAPVKVVKKIRSNKPVRSFLRKLFR